MTQQLVKIVERDESPLFVSLISAGLQRPYFLSALNWDLEIVDHEYENGTHFVSADDFGRLRAILRERSSQDSAFFQDYANKCLEHGERLLAIAAKTARSTEKETPALIEGFRRFTQATKENIPFLLATVAVERALEPIVVAALERELPGGQASASGILPKLMVPKPQAAAIQEIHSSYAIALQILETPAVAKWFTTGKPDYIAANLYGESPLIGVLIDRHLSEFSWLRTHGYRYEPLTPAELVERLQTLLKRWSAERLRALVVQSSDTFDFTTILGFAPTPSLESMVNILRLLVSLRFYRIDVHLKADCVFRPFLAQISKALDISHEQLVFCGEDEIIAALRKEVPLNRNEIVDRTRNGFSVHRHTGQVSITAYEKPFRTRSGSRGSGSVVGMSACIGRATGRARVVFAAAELTSVNDGDILVTTMTTPDLMLAIEKAAGILTDEGGILSHAAIISRELGIPCIIGTGNATQAIRDGSLIELDASQPQGVVRVLEDPMENE
jgi:phosphohistidine swiveling domain-containing protein